MHTSHIELNMDKLLEIDGNLGPKAQKVVQKLAQDTQGYIVTHFSATAPQPSPPGAPPAVQTTQLRTSVVAEPDGIDEFTWWLLVGAEYGLPLEFGTMRMAARPFVRPALRWIAANVPKGLLRSVVE